MTGNGLFGAIEAGGTKFNCAVGTGPDDLRARLRIPTTTPEETLGRCVEFFQQQSSTHGALSAIGIACFGPLDPDQDSPTWGFITSTPKPGWANSDIAGVIGRAIGVPVAFDTDVNGSAFGEWKYGAAQGVDDFMYLTVGTGIGGAALVNGRLLHGMIHPEMGHVRVPHDRQRDPYVGRCPFHGDCLEGLASGPALEDRWGAPAETLLPDHEAWTLEGHYLGLALADFVCTLSPRRIVLGGGVMEQPALLPIIRREVVRALNGYVASPALLERIDEYIVAPGLADRAGVVGALALARERLG